MSVFYDLLSKEINFEEKCKKENRVCLYLIVDLSKMEDEINVCIGSHKRENRPCLIKVIKDTRAKIAFLTGQKRNFDININECVKGECERFFKFLEKAYIFEDLFQKPIVRELSTRLIEDEEILMLCGPCDFNEELPI